jgi:hypothetical protein
MTLKEGDRIAVLEKEKEYWISKNCKNCEARKVLNTLTKLQAKKALAKVDDMRIAPGIRLCDGLGGMTWVLQNEKKENWSICEFKDKSYVLTDDLAGLMNKLKVH